MARRVTRKKSRKTRRKRLEHELETVSGRKSDVSDAEWLQQLHTFGLLPKTFRPESAICELRGSPANEARWWSQRHGAFSICKKRSIKWACSYNTF